MIKMIYCITRRPDLSREEFLRTWLEDHAPLVTSLREAIGAVRYVQSHTGSDDMNDGLRASRDLEEPYDGITEIWWDSREAFEAALSTPEGIEAGRALLEDEKRFIDFSRSRMFLSEEHEIF
jgi:uncharacterized protein (TIGR02118 family)